MFSFVLFRSGPIPDLTLKRAWAVALCVMGSRQWLLGDACTLKRARVIITLRHGVWDSRGWWHDKRTNCQGTVHILNMTT
jgi:hypothetical protein